MLSRPISVKFIGGQLSTYLRARLQGRVSEWVSPSPQPSPTGRGGFGDGF